MKKIIIAVLLVIGTAFTVHAYEEQRMDRLGDEWQKGVQIVYYHDHLGGREFACFYPEGLGSNISCVATGREWK
jgi:nucleoside-specific outer membrane channel protein Tsx